MEPRLFARYQVRAKILKALAHPTRLFIMDELSREERCVNDLAAMVEADTSTISRHLTIMKNAGVIVQEKRGSQVFHKLRVPCVLSFFSCIEAVIRSLAEEQMDLSQ